MHTPENQYKKANEQKYFATNEREKYKTQPGKIVKVERFRARCHQIIPRAKKVLDIGGGGGIWMDILREEHCVEEVYALDISPVILQERDSRDISIVGDMEHLPFDDASFDATFFFASLHHVAKTEQALTEAFRVTRLGGYLVLYEPTSWKMRFHRHGIEPTPDGVEFCFSLPYILRALIHTGWGVTYFAHEGFLRRWAGGRVSVSWLRRLARFEETLDEIPILRDIFGFFGDSVLIVAKKDSMNRLHFSNRTTKESAHSDGHVFARKVTTGPTKK